MEDIFNQIAAVTMPTNRQKVRQIKQTINFPISLMNETFYTHRDLYNWYYGVDIKNTSFLREIGATFWREKIIDVADLVHNPENYILNTI